MKKRILAMVCAVFLAAVTLPLSVQAAGLDSVQGQATEMIEEIKEQLERDLRVIFYSLHNYMLHKISRIINPLWGHNRTERV